MTKLSQTDIEKIIRLYTMLGPDGLWRSANAIAEMFGVTNTGILYRLKQHGVPVRTCGETQAGHAYRPIINKPPYSEAPPTCQCGCEQAVKWDRKHRRWFRYVKGHYRPPRPHHDKEWLFQEYVVNERSATDMAAQCGVSPGVIYKFLRKFGIERRTQAETLKLTGAVRGPNNPAWKGGVAKWDYSHDWKAHAWRIRNRDDWTCQICGERRTHWDGNLHVHHIDGDKLNDDSDNLISVCAACHGPLHSHSVTLSMSSE